LTNVAYFSNGTSIYDLFFLIRLSERFNTILLTFNPSPRYLPSGNKVLTIPQMVGALRVHDSPRFYGTILPQTVMLRKTLREVRPDVLIGCGGLQYGFVAALSNFRPLILFIWGSEVLIFPKFLPFRAFVKHSLKKADLVVVDSEVQRRACIGLGCDEGKIVALPWVDIHDLVRRAEDVKVDKDKFREALGWNISDPVIVCTRMHWPIYNIDSIIRAIPLVLERIPNARFLFIGNGPLTKSYRRLVKDIGVERNVHFAGFVPHDDIFYYLKNSDIYVSASLSDGTSASLIEAMACKLACVVSDIPGNREWIEDMENGLLFPAKNYHALAKRLIMLIEDRNLSATLANRAFERACAKGDWKQNSKVLFDSIERLACSVH